MSRARIPIGIPPNTRLLRIERVIVPQDNCWRIWLHTSDFVYGTYLHLYDDGRIERITTRVSEGDDIIQVKPPDKHSES